MSDFSLRAAFARINGRPFKDAARLFWDALAHGLFMRGPGVGAASGFCETIFIVKLDFRGN